MCTAIPLFLHSPLIAMNFSFFRNWQHNRRNLLESVNVYEMMRVSGWEWRRPSDFPPLNQLFPALKAIFAAKIPPFLCWYTYFIGWMSTDLRHRLICEQWIRPGLVTPLMSSISKMAACGFDICLATDLMTFDSCCGRLWPLNESGDTTWAYQVMDNV